MDEKKLDQVLEDIEYEHKSNTEWNQFVVTVGDDYDLEKLINAQD